MKKTLCLFYTRTNTTRLAMERLAALLDADLDEYTDGKDRKGITGYIASCIDSFRKSLPKVYIKGTCRPQDYERVIIGMPVWAEGPSVVGKAILDKYRNDYPAEVYLVVTHMAKADYGKKIDGLDQYLNVPHKAHLSLRTKNNPEMKAEIRKFAEQIGK